MFAQRSLWWKSGEPKTNGKEDSVKKTRKLVVSVETIRVMTTLDLTKVQGGGGRFHTDACHSALNTQCKC
jgi:hypothetical protein